MSWELWLLVSQSTMLPRATSSVPSPQSATTAIMHPGFRISDRYFPLYLVLWTVRLTRIASSPSPSSQPWSSVAPVMSSCVPSSEMPMNWYFSFLTSIKAEPPLARQGEDLAGINQIRVAADGALVQLIYLIVA